MGSSAAADREPGTAFWPSARAWRLADDCGHAALRPWDDGWLVFNPLSGHTHLLDDVSGHLLTVLSGGPRPVETLHAEVSSLLDLPCDALLVARADELLAQLDELGLIESAAAC